MPPENLTDAAGLLLQVCVRELLATLRTEVHFVMGLDVGAITGAG